MSLVLACVLPFVRLAALAAVRSCPYIDRLPIDFPLVHAGPHIAGDLMAAVRATRAAADQVARRACAGKEQFPGRYETFSHVHFAQLASVSIFQIRTSTFPGTGVVRS